MVSRGRLWDEDEVRPLVEEMCDEEDTALAGGWIGVRPVEEIRNADDATLAGGHIDDIGLRSECARSLPFADEPVTF